MQRVVTALAVAAMLATPATLAGPVGAAESPITIVTVERGPQERPARYACYTLADQNNGGRGGGCDNGLNGDAKADGRVVITPTGECSPCVVTQSLPDKPSGDPTDYLRERPQITSPGGTVTFRNFLKPVMVVTVVDARTGKPAKGACIGLAQAGVPGSGSRICDGNPGGGDADQDKRKNGKIRTKRLPTPDQTATTVTYEVTASTPGHTAKRVLVKAEPAKTGAVEVAKLTLRKSR